VPLRAAVVPSHHRVVEGLGFIAVAVGFSPLPLSAAAASDVIYYSGSKDRCNISNTYYIGNYYIGEKTDVIGPK